MAASYDLAILHIHQLVTMAGPERTRLAGEMENLSLVADGAILIRRGRIQAVGPTDRVTAEHALAGSLVVDLAGRPLTALPGFVDSHTHPAFHGTRENEYELRIRGASYLEIAAQGGGILNSAGRVAQASVEQIVENILKYARLFLCHGTTTVEAKSGYGLSVEGELKLLRSIRAAADRTPLDLRPTFLGAHAYPREYRQNHRGYLDALIGEMMPAIARENLAEFCDVFCDEGFFSVDEAREILRAGQAHGLRSRIHADELAPVGAAELAAEVGALSADHLERISAAGIQALAGAGVVAGLLPGTAFNLGLDHYPPARAMIAAGVPVALATDFNPGTCFTLSMPMVISIACCQMRMTPAEALTAATVNAAHALGLGDDRGTLEPGRRADVIFMDCSDYRMIPYFFGVNQCVATLKDGIPVSGSALFPSDGQPKSKPEFGLLSGPAVKGGKM